MLRKMWKSNAYEILKKYRAAQFLAAFCFCYALSQYFHESSLIGRESILNFAIFVATYCLLLQVPRFEKKLLRIATIFSVLYSGVLVVGKALYHLGRFSSLFVPYPNFLKTIISIIGFAAVLRVIICYLMLLLDRIGDSFDQVTHTCLWIRKKYVFFLFWGMIFLAWIPAYLAYYPGMFSYDAASQVPQALAGLSSYNRHHPPLHTMILGLFLKSEAYTGIHGIALYTIFQMLILSFSLAYTLHYLIKRRIDWRMILLVLVFYMINPVIAVFSLAVTKDVPFTSMMVISTILLCDLYTDGKAFFKSYKKIALGICICLSCLLRNNALYAFAVAIPAVLWGAKGIRKKTVILLISSIASVLVISGPVYDALGIQKGPTREMLSVPMMQIADVVYYDDDTLSEDFKNRINTYMPYDSIPDLFNPRFADSIKANFDEKVYKENVSLFYKVWARLFFQYPDNYISAFLNLNLPYWYQDAHAVDAYSSVAYIETHIYELPEYPMERQSKASWLLENYYSKVANFELFSGKLFLASVFQLSMPIWVFIFAFFVLMYKRIPSKFFAFMPMVGLWFTYLLGPVSNFRYIFPLHVFMAFLLVVMIQPQKIFGSDNTEK